MLAEGGPFAFYNEGVAAEIVRGLMGGRRQDFRPARNRRVVLDPRRLCEDARGGRRDARGADCGGGCSGSALPAGDLVAEDGAVLHKASGKSATYGELAIDAAKLDMPSGVTLKDKADWKILGKPQQRKDMLAKVTGAPIFGIDVTLPDMLYGTVRMSPRFWAKPVKSDLSKAEKMPGVVKIVPIETTYGSGFGVIAREHLGGLQCGRRDRGRMGRGRLSARQRRDFQGAAGHAGQRSRARRCATTAMSTRPLPMRRATGWSKPNIRCRSWRIHAWSR